ncbi:MAG: nucleoside hydrolase [Acidobacteria bacterium]|jgi:inosine-uridine nucleoside N-ribohydrolase|nr:nucleoside hydrolase [Acidobacteriota bacterium]
MVVKILSVEGQMQSKSFQLVTLVLLLCWGNGFAQTNAEKPQRGRRGKAASQKKILPRRAVILTTDCGAEMDDQWTLAQLAVAPEFDLRGIVTTHAPSLKAPAAETAAGSVREVLDHLPLAARPSVFAGSSAPLTAKNAARKNQGVDFIIEQSKSFSTAHRLVVLITGAATDVASALILDPTLGDRIEVVAMGFERYPEGNDSWNVKNDVRAWQVVLESSAVIVVGDARVTLRDLRVTRASASELFAMRGIAGQYLVNIHTAWLDRDPPFIEKVTGSRDTWAIWDSVTLAYLLGFTKSSTYPRPALGDDLRFIHSSSNDQGRARVTWITAIDSDKLWNHFTKNLDRANAFFKRTLK